ncbi:hypothetical protein GGX14DRAFT_580803 [Mycena pura]|uniref:Uncharacterized protein n=1 Tax=Mycena pura TaxID=153505 RepID=A0AAD6UPA3_9AGAR|nr:hypothetical protein GGX14DRAFT_580803 [Mycena pura]
MSLRSTCPSASRHWRGPSGSHLVPLRACLFTACSADTRTNLAPPPFFYLTILCPKHALPPHKRSLSLLRTAAGPRIVFYRHDPFRTRGACVPPRAALITITGGLVLEALVEPGEQARVYCKLNGHAVMQAQRPRVERGEMVVTHASVQACVRRKTSSS